MPRFQLPENPDIAFEQDPDSKEVTMTVCGQPITKKRVQDFTLKTVRRQFGVEIREHKDEICPTGMDDKGRATE